MDNNAIEKFINESFIGEKVKLPVNIIIHRTELSPNELATIKDQGVYEYQIKKDTMYEMEAGGDVIAWGKVVKRKGEYFFKVIDLNGGEL